MIRSEIRRRLMIVACWLYSLLLILISILLMQCSLLIVLRRLLLVVELERLRLMVYLAVKNLLILCLAEILQVRGKRGG